MDPIESWVDRDELRRLADALLATPAKPAPDPPNDATYGEQFVGFTGGGPTPPPAADQAARHAAADMAQAAQAPQPPAGAPQEAIIHKQAKDVLANARQIAQRGGMLDAAQRQPTAPSKPPATPEAPAQPTRPRPVAAQLTQVSPVPGAAQPATTSATPFLERLKAYGTWLRQGARSKAFFLIDREGGVLLDEVQSPKLQQVARTLAQASRTANRQAGAAAIGNLHIKVAADSILEVVPVDTRYGPLILGIIMERPLGPENVASVARALQRVVDGNSGGGAP